MIWAAVLLLWLPMAVFASDARPYALLVLLGTVQAAAFCAMMREPTRTRALWWVLPTLAMGLTQYIALLPGLIQGLLLLAVHRGRAVRLWPAALPFVVLVAWAVLHLPFVARVAGVGAAMTSTLGWGTAAQLPVLIAGEPADEASLHAAIEAMMRRNRPFLADPILDPIPFGFTASIGRYQRLRERFPEAPILMGVGNLTELVEADTAGMQALLFGICAELDIAAVLTTQVSGHARRAIREADLARRVMHAAARHQNVHADRAAAADRRGHQNPAA